MWFITSNLEAGIDLHNKHTFGLLVDYVKRGVSTYYAGGSKRKQASVVNYHVAEPGDVIIQPSCAVHAVFTEARKNRISELLWAVVTVYEEM